MVGATGHNPQMALSAMYFKGNNIIIKSKIIRIPNSSISCIETVAFTKQSYTSFNILYFLLDINCCIKVLIEHGN